jgi:4'-phosphopantetheinyl transferase EntD
MLESAHASLPGLLAALFPPFVSVEVAGAADAAESALAAEESCWLAPMVSGRRREFTMGRNAARRAMARLGVGPAAIGRHSSDRDPLWPAGIVGSISHAHGVVVAACARENDARAIGVDVERAGPLGADLVREICREDELEALRGVAPPAPSDWPKLLFSIKEAGYKAWFPSMRTPLEFHAMRVIPDPAARRFSAHVASAVVMDAAWEVKGGFAWNAELVVAGALLSGRSA